MWWRRRDPRIGDEVRFHRDQMIEDDVARGVDRQEAERRAFLEFGNVGAIEESVRDVRGRWLDDVVRDVRYTVRTLRRSPGFAAVAILTLALGVGVNAAVFSLFYGVLVQPLPVPEPRQLVNLSSPGPRPGTNSCGTIGSCEAVFSYPMFRDLERIQTVFTGIAAHYDFGVNLAYRGQTTTGQGLLVSGSYFPVLDLRPALGRLLGAEDDRAVGDAEVVVLSHAYWQSHFGGRPDIVGEAVVINGQPLTIVGVTPEAFHGTTIGLTPDVFVPITMRWRLAPDPRRSPDNRRARWIYLFARLKPGVSLEQARTAIDTPYRAIINEVEAPLQESLSDERMALFRAKGIRLDPGSRGQSDFVTDARVPVTLLLALTVLVLLIACVNVANLLLARAAARSTELATRLSIGATRGRLVAQLLTESSVLAVVAAIASLLVAQWTAALLFPDGAADAVAEGGSIPVAAGALAIVTGLVVGLFPALHAARPDVVSSLRAQTGTSAGGRGRSRIRVTLATAQVALSMVLVVLAALFTKSLANVSRVDPGLKSDGVLTFRIVPQRNGYTDARSAALFERLEEELVALPGVSAVTSSKTTLLSGEESSTDAFVQGFDAGVDADRETRYEEIGHGYFRTLGIPLIAGREFTAADSDGAPRVVIVNERFASKFGLGRDAIGQRMSRASPALDLEIVGIVRDFKQSDLSGAVAPMYFAPHRQGTGRPGRMVFYVRTSADTGPTASAIRQVVRGLDPNLPVEGLRTMDEVIRGSTARYRLMSVMTGAFAILALLVAAIGLYGMLAYAVAQRTPEIGLRMALGATRSQVRGMVLRQVSVIAAIGGAIGLAVALLVGRVTQTLLFGLQFHDPVVLASSIAVLAAVALAAGFVPAHRAARVDPMRALKYE